VFGQAWNHSFVHFLHSYVELLIATVAGNNRPYIKPCTGGSDVVLEDWPWSRGASRSNFRSLGLGLRPPGLGLGLGFESPGLGLVAWPWLQDSLSVINTQSSEITEFHIKKHVTDIVYLNTTESPRSFC
jgi:hypothetical protein